MELETKTVRGKGRPKKYFDTSKVYEWVDESAFQSAKRDYKKWEDAFNECKRLTKSDFESIEQYDESLRSEFPDLNKLDINQLYILKNLDRTEYERAFRELKSVSKPSTDVKNYTVTIPVERAEEYSKYLAIVNAFNELRKDNNTLNVMQIPQIVNNKIIFDVRRGCLAVNAYLFTKDYR
jgi:hypothetical protein